ncbi:MAG TPA: hypothetical protein DCG57_00975 [Candidatus Riflebacteria bacterium]|jgi:hypothetical protein|nr:hypothetical protein [Candidatus Riflebacteria bacterium]
MFIRRINALTTACLMLLYCSIIQVSAQPKFAAQDATIRSIAFDQRGRMWVATFGRGLWVVNESGISKFYDETLQMPYPMINNLLVDVKGLWVATAGGGCIKINTTTDRIEPVGQHAGFEKLHALTKTSAGQVIIGSVGSGTAFLSNNTWQPVKKQQSISLAWVNSIVEWQNRLWLGTSTGLYSSSADLGDWKPKFEQLNRGVNHLLVHEDRLFIATTRHGLYSIAPGGEPVKVPAIDGMIHASMPAENGILVIGEKHLWKLADGKAQKLEPSVPLAKCGAVDAKNRFFIGTTDGKIFISDNGTDFKVKYSFGEAGLEEQNK